MGECLACGWLGPPVVVVSDHALQVPPWVIGVPCGLNVFDFAVDDRADLLWDGFGVFAEIFAEPVPDFGDVEFGRNPFEDVGEDFHERLPGSAFVHFTHISALEPQCRGPGER